MNFEDMQVIWDSQNEQPLYGVNESGLHTILRRKSRRFGRMVFWQELQTFGSILFLVTLILFLLFANYLGIINKIGALVALTGWDILALLIALGCWVPVFVTKYVGRKQQKHREGKFTSSLRDDLDRDIEQTEYQIRIRKNVLLWFIPPYIGIALFFLVVMVRNFGLTEWLMVPISVFLIVCLTIETRSVQRLVEQKMLPRKRELETLREKLTDPSR